LVALVALGVAIDTYLQAVPRDGLQTQRNKVETLDIIGDSVYLLYANLCDLTRQTARVSGSDRTHARRVYACAAGLCCSLYCTVAARPDLGRQGAPTPERRRRHRHVVTDGRPVALHPHLPEDQCATN
jgi:hypothetical protein